MDYEKKYKEALERAKALYEQAKKDGNSIWKTYEYIIPELAESEDERIRKDLIEALKISKTVGELKFILPEPTREECIAYLEKQKEQKPVNHNLTTFHRDVVYCAMCDKNLDEGLRCNLEIVYNVLKDIVAQTPIVYEQKEQKPAEWSEEDERMRQTAIEACKTVANDYENSNERFYKCKYWLETRLKSLRPQPNTVSIKDATKFGNLEYERGVKDGIQHAKNHQWKPSEEQMRALEKAIIRAHSTEDIPILLKLRDSLGAL